MDKLVICKHYLECEFDCGHKKEHVFYSDYKYFHNAKSLCSDGCLWNDIKKPSCIDKVLVDRKKKINKLENL